jgi:hypothetical protein
VSTPTKADFRDSRWLVVISGSTNVLHSPPVSSLRRDMRRMAPSALLPEAEVDAAADARCGLALTSCWPERWLLLAQSASWSVLTLAALAGAVIPEWF